MTLFQQAETLYPLVDVNDIRRQMNEDIAKLENEYTGMASGIINPFFKLLNTAQIVCKYVGEFTLTVVLIETLTINQIVIIEEMIEITDNIALEIKKLL
jgi:hypothetical protein